MSNSSLLASTKFKILIPVIYLLLSLGFFLLAWPDQAKANHFIGLAGTIVVFMFWIIARIQLGNAFSLAPKANFLVKHGLYSKFRHPVYYFSILAVIGIGIFIWKVPVLIPIIGLVILEYIRIQKEEKLLTAKLGDEYARYKKTTWI